MHTIGGDRSTAIYDPIEERNQIAPRNIAGLLVAEFGDQSADVLTFILALTTRLVRVKVAEQRGCLIGAFPCFRASLAFPYPSP